MSTSLDTAILAQEELVGNHPQGAPLSPKPGDADWFLLYARALGLSFLRSMRAAGAGNSPEAAKRFYHRASACVKSVEGDPLGEQ